MNEEITQLTKKIIDYFVEDALKNANTYQEAIDYLDRKRAALRKEPDTPVTNVGTGLVIEAMIQLKKEALQLPLKNN
ncbi:hypothetical protein [Lapidilactobacillus gannanensis]|uniref:Uncharacterized protein n=1 Tax=Lapidilactobacillus gannanensis TaxID=2486002 RepID=A0ABW4BKY5_9LACO|nr:hypothetical protein [Lapidilactobacillus gannanensis]